LHIYIVDHIIIEPTLPELQKKFRRVPAWESICPYLLDNDGGLKTEIIYRNNNSVQERRDAMLREFLRMSNPTWRTVVYALRCGDYNMLADEIEREHNYSQHAEDLAKQFQNCK